MPEHRKLRVFLCHASQDRDIVQGLYDRLQRESWIDPWLDIKKLLPGQNWDLEIRRAVEKSDIVLVCLSTNSVSKEGYVQKELRMVLDIADHKPDGTIFLIPLCLDPCEIPYRLRNWQYVKYYPRKHRPQAFEHLKLSLVERAKVVGIYRRVDKNPAAPRPQVAPKPNRKTGRLIGRRGEYYGQVIKINQTISIGRLTSNNVRLKDASVSRRHAKIVQSKGRFYVLDLDSSAGTFLNGMRIQPNALFLLKTGDSIRFGSEQKFEFRI